MLRTLHALASVAGLAVFISSGASAGSFSVTYSIQGGYSNELLFTTLTTQPVVGGSVTVSGNATRGGVSGTDGFLLATQVIVNITGQNGFFTGTGYLGTASVAGFGRFFGANSLGTDATFGYLSLTSAGSGVSGKRFGFPLFPSNFVHFFGSFGGGGTATMCALTGSASLTLCYAFRSSPTRTVGSALNGFSVFGQEVSRTLDVGAVPEPTTIGLLGGGLLGAAIQLLRTRRRGAKRAG
jgi:hypothetical protein